MRRHIWKPTSAGVFVRLAFLGVLMAIASHLRSQEVPAKAGRASGSPQAASRDYRFEVASIRPIETPTSAAPATFTPELYRYEKARLSALVWDAFKVRYSYQIQFPPWMDSSYFAVNATVPEGATKADLPIMLQHLLEDRFGLKFHHESRLTGGFELVVGKSGPKLARSAEPASDQSVARGPQVEFDKDGVPHFGKNAKSGQIYSATTAIWIGRHKTMVGLAADLANRLGAPVRDATGLEGEYDYEMTYALEGNLAQAGAVSAGSNGSTPGGEGASTPAGHSLLRDALQEQLGLKLISIKNVSVDVVVVDSAKREPTEN